MSCIDLDCIRDSVLATLSGTAVLTQPVYASDGMGGGTATYTAYGTASCLVSSMGKPIEAVVAESVMSLPGFSILLPHGTAVKARDRITSNGWTYEVQGHDRGATLAIFTQATCIRVGDG
jgi:hypothetical protein